MSWQILEFAGFKELIAQPLELPTRAKRKRAKLKRGREVRFRPTIVHISISLWVIVIFFLVFFPNIGPAIATAQAAPFAPSDAWVGSLTWLKENTPDPFGNPDFYYELPEPALSPKPAYGVMAWWDYGYWINRIAHRVPNTNPSQPSIPITNTAGFFLSQDENSTNEIIEEMGSSYIIIDYQTVTGKFYAVAMWAGRERTEFFDVYYLPQEGKLMPVQLFHPEYYRSLVARLYNFDGKAVTPEKTMVISYQELVSQKGIPFKAITSKQEFSSYEAATAYILSQKSANYKIVGTNPFISPVPLEALEHCKLIYSSDNGVAHREVGMVPEVKVFQYMGDK
ncbi:MAG: hypothetical protein QMC90_03110 [Dehalococcoidales bacterium]|nr:hypothetical protein [Dehalococcoidales bacterium]